MPRLTSSTSKVSAGVFVALTVLGTLGTPSTASAKLLCHTEQGQLKCVNVPDVPIKISPNNDKAFGQITAAKPHGDPGWAYGAAALGGMAVGMIAASAASASNGACYFVRRRAVDEDGNMYVRRVRVCE